MTRNRPAGSVAGSDRAQVEPGGHGWLVITQVGQSDVHLSPLAAARAPDAPRADARAERAGSSGVSCDGTRAEACRWNRPACFGVRPHGPPARPPISRARGDAAATRPGPAAKGERGTGFPRAAAGPPLHRQRSQIRLCRSAPLPRDFGPGRSAAASTLGRRCAARWASPFAPAGRWLPEIVVMTHTDGA